jgi:hypothetical protein
MDDAVEIACYIIVASIIFLLIYGLRSKPKKHQWFEVGSSDIANAERKKRKGK